MTLEYRNAVQSDTLNNRMIAELGTTANGITVSQKPAHELMNLNEN